jgi:hypothetical protein
LKGEDLLQISQLTPLRTPVMSSCQHLYSKKNAGLICISQLFGTSADHSFIAGIFGFEGGSTTTICGNEKGRAKFDPALDVLQLNTCLTLRLLPLSLCPYTATTISWT